MKTLRIEIWMKDNMEWSLEGNGGEEQLRQTGMKIRSLFKDVEELKLVKNKEDISTVSKDTAIDAIKNSLTNENLMLCDENFTRTMAFFYLNR